MEWLRELLKKKTAEITLDVEGDGSDDSLSLWCIIVISTCLSFLVWTVLCGMATFMQKSCRRPNSRHPTDDNQKGNPFALLLESKLAERQLEAGRRKNKMTEMTSGEEPKMRRRNIVEEEEDG